MSDAAARKRALRAIMVSLGFERDRSETRAYRYTGKVSVVGRSVSLALTFADLEFTRLPTATLLAPEAEAPNVVAHLSTSGVLCFAVDADIVLDRYNIAGTAVQCFEMARRGLERALTRKYVQHEIAAEFPQHWQGDTFYYDLDSSARAHLIFLDRPHGACPLLVSKEAAVKRFATSKKQVSDAIRSGRRVHVVHVTEPLTFAPQETAPATMADYLSWLARIAPGQTDSVLAAMSQNYPRADPVFVSAPNGCVGVEPILAQPMLKALQRPAGLRRFLRQGRLGIRRFSGTRVDEPFIFGRNMIDQHSLTGKRIALIGCGAVGSYLAAMLVHAGAGSGGGSLLLLDDQRLEPGNVGRHFLGLIHVGEYKSLALRDELVRSFPDANISATTTEAITYLTNGLHNDLVIDATGEEALSIAINEQVVRAKRKGDASADALYVRLFGNGAAAQSLLVCDLEHACFKCLRPVIGAPARFDPMRTDAAVVGRVATCGEGAFVPYAASAPNIAASLALESVLEWNSKSVVHRLRTLRIDPKSTNDITPKNPQRSQSCPCCAKASAA